MGWSTASPDSSPCATRSTIPPCARWSAACREIVAGKEGILIEDKGCSVAIHWRLAPHEKDFALATAQAAVEASGSDYRVQHGRAVAEILPSAAGKGKVIERFLHEAPYKGRGARSSSATT